MATEVSPSRPDGPPGVDPRVMHLLGQRIHELSTRQQELVLALHQRLLELVPDASRLPGSGRAMCQRLVAVVLHAAGDGRSPEAARGVVQRVGADNFIDGFPSEQYSSVTHALLHAVRVVHPGDWSSALSSAWVEYLIWLRDGLLVGAEVQRAQDVARRVTAPGAQAMDARGRHVIGHNAAAPRLGASAPPPSAVHADDLDEDGGGTSPAAPA